MNLNYLKIFHTVAKHQGFTKAAEELLISQPTISVQIKNLEQELGLELFQKLGRKVYLTEAGQTLYQYTTKIFNQLEEAENALRDLKGLGKGRLLVGASTTPGIYVLPEILGQYRKLYPGIEVVLDISNSHEIEQKLLHHELEIAFCGGEGIVHPQIEAKTITHDELVIVVAEDHPLARKSAVTLDQILTEPFILREPGSSTRIALEQRLQQLGKKIKVAMQFSSLEAIKQAVAANLGIALLSRFVIDQEVCAGRLHILKIPELTIRREIKLLRHKDNKPSAQVQAFLRLLQERLTPKCST
ncbi:selenium metabolism-associated LysR family transcriptional regulator [Carboxydothermus ferrireducens]|uniref:DNA-binding transcriptional LysR family regulator n=1 Tax=Carboxydothermus ferrireducens DSM 11255 TaxID=1119529 RepID=A0ABX2R624_9THEO|nr:selenium metabolism-associated LysR family transcriptional regulator [Carboxydothermus ferrireducens]NYE56626.1 DNA-binding transcriptional LysR family regulator [Carboxydothermus ferrireducens DSM 11255]